MPSLTNEMSVDKVVATQYIPWPISCHWWQRLTDSENRPVFFLEISECYKSRNTQTSRWTSQHLRGSSLKSSAKAHQGLTWDFLDQANVRNTELYSQHQGNTKKTNKLFLKGQRRKPKKLLEFSGWIRTTECFLKHAEMRLRDPTTPMQGAPSFE